MHEKLIFISYIVKKIPGSIPKFGGMVLNITRTNWVLKFIIGYAPVILYLGYKAHI